ncbi:MAG TPA: hypothetical protein VFE58_09505 [Tepidisphaeraceae bacterium]|jgi:hypothetical protein|nr:hypothetical protein [Tepidisphaeraceae bacterium]
MHSKQNRISALRLAAALSAAILLAGCQSAHIEQPLTTTYSANDTATQMEFWHRLATSPLASNDEAFHGLLLFTDGSDPSPDYASRVSTLQSRHLLPSDFHGAADEAVTRGTLSVPFVKILHYHGGVTMTLFGATPRYSTRLLVYKGIYPDSSPNQAVSGADFVGFIGKIEDVQRDTIEKPAALLPDQPVATADNDFNINLSENFHEDSDLAANLPEFSFDPLYLDTAATSPTTTPVFNTEVTIDGIEGKFVQVRASADQPWQPAKIGDKYGQDAEFRTGPKSAVRFVIQPDQTYTLDRVSTLKVAQIIQQGKKLTTQVDLTYGRVRYDLEPINKEHPGADRSPYQVSETGIEHATTIRSPNSTLAVRGTRVSLYDQPPYAPQALSLVGRAEFRNARRELIVFGGKKTQTNRIRADQPSAAETALADTIVDPSIRLARTDEDTPLLSTLISRGSVVTFDRGSGLDIVSGGFPPTTDKELTPVLPGKLDFVLRWTGNANLDLSVANQAGGTGEFIYPAAGLTISPSGGRTRFDHIGGPHGGIEVVYWPGAAPSGYYSVGINGISGVTTGATIDVFKNGHRIPLVDTSANGGSGGLVTTFHTTVSPGQTSAVIAPIGVPVPPIGPPIKSKSAIR